MVFGAILGGAKKIFGGGGKKKGAAPVKKLEGPTEGDKLKSASARTTKELLTPIRKNGKNGNRKAKHRYSIRSGGR